MRALKLLLVLVVVAAAVVGWIVLVPFGPTHETFVDIPSHTGTVGIATALQSGAVVRNRWFFAVLREIKGGTLKAGEYRFAQPASMLEVYDRLQRGDVFTIQVTIPEGYNLFDIAAAVEEAGLVSRSTFLDAAAANTGSVRQWDPKATSL